MEKQTKPNPAQFLGIRIVGWANFAFFGLLSFVANTAFFILSFNPQFLAKMKAHMPQGLNAAGMPHVLFLRTVFFWQAILAIGFIISGVGILKRSQKARLFSLYFAGLLLVLVTLGVAVQALGHYALSWANISLSVFWPGLMVFVLTSSSANSYFKKIKSS